MRTLFLFLLITLSSFIGYAQPIAKPDTVFLSGTTQVNLAILSNDRGTSIVLSQYSINGVKYSPSTNTRTISGFGKIVLKSNGTGSFIPVSTYTNGSFKYTIKDSRSRTTSSTVYFITKQVIVVPPPTDTQVIVNPPVDTTPVTNPPAPIGTSYTLTTAATTSAGVYLMDGTLVRTLWTNIKQPAGTYPINWDKLDDYGVLVTAPAQVKVLTHNITETWYKHIGNTSNPTSLRHDRHRGLRGIYDAVEFNGFIYYCTGLPEGETTTKKASLTNLGVSIPVMPTVHGDINMETRYLAADGSKVYHVGIDAYNAKLSWCYATDIKDAEYLFSNGVQVATTYGRIYPKAIDVQTNNLPRGIAVGNHVYISHDTGVFVLDKITGSLVSRQNINLTDICIDNGFLYGIAGNNVNKFAILANGDLSYVSTQTYVKKPIAISVKNGIVEVHYGHVDFNENAIRGFIQHGANGIWKSEATRIVRTLDTVENAQIAYLPMLYNVSVDKNNPSRVFANFIEYEVNYVDMSWKIKKDWSQLIPKTSIDVNIQNFTGMECTFRDVVTVGTRTLAILRNYNANGTRSSVIVELIPTGVKALKVFGEWQAVSLDLNGDAIESDYANNRILRYVYNGSTWNAPVVITTIPNLDIQGPGYNYSNTNGTVIFNPGMNWQGRHLGEVRNGKWLYKVSPSFNYPAGTYYPKSDTFPTGYYPPETGGGRTGYAGGKVYRCDSFVTYSYVGEFWGSNGGQVNKWNIYKDGLMFYQYGATAFSGNDGQKMAGNAYSATFYKIGSTYYLAHADESYWACIQIAKFDFSSLKTIVIQIQ